MKRILSLLLVLFGMTQRMDACTTFLLVEGGIALFGRNYDWVVGDGLLMTNKRGVRKTSIIEAPNRAADWKSRYGNLTFNQYGREFPTGGMNEVGVVVELLWFDGTRYPEADARPALGGLEWIQYQLDMSANVDEVIKNADQIRIASTVPLHFLVADRTGRAATIEYLNGKLVTHQGASLPVAALANSSYQESLKYLNKQDAGDIQGSNSSLDRFVNAIRMIRGFKRQKSSNPVEYAFSILNKVAQPNTQWRIVYDLKHSTIYFSTNQSKRKIVNLKEFSFDCSTPVMIADLHDEGSPGFIPYDRKLNLKLIQSSYKQTNFLSNTAYETLNRLSVHPENFRCENAGKNSN